MKFSIFAGLHHFPGVFMGINREHTGKPIYDGVVPKVQSAKSHLDNNRRDK